MTTEQKYPESAPKDRVYLGWTPRRATAMYLIQLFAGLPLEQREEIVGKVLCREKKSEQYLQREIEFFAPDVFASIQDKSLSSHEARDKFVSVLIEVIDSAYEHRIYHN